MQSASHVLRKICLLSGCCLLFTLFPFLSPAQDSSDAVLESLTTSHDLSSNYVTDITQDKDGFLWIVTADGLNRFDGTEIVHFFHDSTANSIPSNYIHCVDTTKDGKLMIGTADGLCFYDRQKKTFQTFRYKDNSGFEKFDNFIYCLTTDEKGNIWVGSPTCIFRLSPQLKLEKVFRSPYSINDIGKERFYFVRKMIRMDKGKLLFFLNTGNYVYEPGSDTLVNIEEKQYDHLSFLRNKYYWDVFGIGQNRLIFFKKGVDSLFLYRENDKRIQSTFFPYNRDPFMSWEQQVSRINDSEFILAYHGRGYSLLTVTDSSLRLTQDQFFGNYQLRKMIIDKQGNWWFVNRFGGLLKKTRRQTRFAYIPLYDKMTNQPIDLPAMVIKKRDDIFWIATYGRGIFTYDPSTGQKRQVRLQGTFDDANSNYIWQLYEHSRDTFWVGTQTGLFWMARKNYSYGRLPAYPGKPRELDSFAITTQYKDSKGRVWIGIGKGNGVCVFDDKTNSFRHYKGRDDNSYVFRYPLDIKEDSKKRLWFVSDENNQLLYYDEARDKMVPVPVFAKDMTAAHSFTCLFIDKQDICWIGSNAGMIRFDPATNTARVYGREKGLCNSLVRDIYEDDSGKLWIATDGGLSCFDQAKETFVNYYRKDGLPMEILNCDFFPEETTGLLYTGGYGGITAFDPAKLVKSFAGPMTLLIDGLEVNNKVYYPEQGELFSLRSNEKNFTIRFASVDMVNGPINRYYYQLKGTGDTSWISLGHQRRISFSNLGPGNYTLSIRSADEAGNFNSDPAVLRFHITPSFTQTAWFYVLIFLLIAALFYLFYRYRIRQLLAMEKVRSNISRDLHDEIGANLANISYLSLLAQKNVKDADQVFHWLTRIHDNTKTVSESMREIVWSINPENDSLEQSIPRMLRYASELLEAKGIHLTASLPGNIDIPLNMDQRRDLYLIFKEAINNLAKHSAATKARITFTLAGGKLNMVAEDNGHGFDPARAASGNGIKNMRDRAAKQKWKIDIATGTSHGTKIELEAQIA